MDIRLKTMPFELEGRKYDLRCNMNVLADVQEAFDGSIQKALSNRSPVKGVLAFLAAMCNDYADAQGWDVRYTARQLGRLLPPAALKSVCADVMELVSSALGGEDEEGGAEKN